MKIKIAYILVMVIAVLGYLLYRSGQKVHMLNDVAAWRADTVRVWQDKAGRYLAEKSALQISSAHAKDQLQAELEQVKNDLGIARSKIASITTATSTTQGTITFDANLNYSDAFSDFSLVNSDRGLQLRYSITDSLLITAYYDRPKFWKAKQLRVKAISYNPATRLTGLDHIEIKNKPGRFAISLHAGYGITRSGLSPYIGVGVGYDVFRF